MSRTSLNGEISILMQNHVFIAMVYLRMLRLYHPYQIRLH
jgi:hypothetical protein